MRDHLDTYRESLTHEDMNDYINIDGYKGINADINGVQPAFSVSAWFQTAGNGEMVSWGSPFSGQRFTFRLNEGRLRTEHGNGNLQGYTTCNDGEWHNFTLTVPYTALTCIGTWRGTVARCLDFQLR
jgi:hypothetical protein